MEASSEEFGRYLPTLIVGYTSGDKETLSLPFLASRSGYASDVANAALRKVVDDGIADNRMMLVDYGTNLEVLFSNMILGKPGKGPRPNWLVSKNLDDYLIREAPKPWWPKRT